MAFNLPTSGAGWRLAGCLVQLGHEIEAAHSDFSCLGTLRNAAHAAQGTGSDHNPFIKDPHTGVGVVRAIDIGGPDNELKQLRQQLWSLYAQQDDRVYRLGYMKGCTDNLINNWGLPFGTHIDTGDAGHLHINVTQANGNNPTAAGYVAALDDTLGWGVASGVAPLSRGAPADGSSAPHTGLAWPGPQLHFGPHDFFGNINGPQESHGGAFPAEKPFVTMIQQRLIALGFVAGVTAGDINNAGPTASSTSRETIHKRGRQRTRSSHFSAPACRAPSSSVRSGATTGPPCSPADLGRIQRALVGSARFGHHCFMATYRRNDAAFEHARRLITAHQYVLSSDWGRAQPGAAEQNRFLKTHSWPEYAQWHLGLSDGAADETKARYAFVLGDFRRIHRMALIASVYRASEWRHKEIELAAHELLQLLDSVSG